MRNNFWEVYTSNGRDPTGKNVIDWVKESEKLGAGEVLLTSVDQEGTRKGFDIDLIKSVTNSIRLPVICSGGYGETTHAKKLIENCEVDAIAIADAFHYSRATVREIKKTLNLSL